MKKILPIIVALIVIIGAGAFYGGMIYAKNNPSRNFQNFRPNGDLNALRQRNGQNMNFINGEVISMDDKSITLKLRDNGSKIIFFGDSTSVSKTVDGAISDLKVGDSIMVTGDSNSDGSISAKQIQLSPNLPPQPDMQQPPDSNVNQAQ